MSVHTQLGIEFILHGGAVIKFELQFNAVYFTTLLGQIKYQQKTPWYGQYLTHPHSHITRALLAMDS